MVNATTGQAGALPIAKNGRSAHTNPLDAVLADARQTCGSSASVTFKLIS